MNGELYVPARVRSYHAWCLDQETLPRAEAQLAQIQAASERLAAVRRHPDGKAALDALAQLAAQLPPDVLHRYRQAILNRRRTS
jgi:hypothetical protein